MANPKPYGLRDNCSRGKKILASEQAHYTPTGGLGGVLQFLPFQTFRVIRGGHAERAGEAGGARRRWNRVATMGTRNGSVSAPGDSLSLAETQIFEYMRAAYGRLFCAHRNPGKRRRAGVCADWRNDSVVIDPHKHGLHPTGAVRALRDPGVADCISTIRRTPISAPRN